MVGSALWLFIRAIVLLQFLGRYIGTIRRAGLLMTVPFTSRKKVPVKVRSFETNDLKVNHADDNPVNTAAIVVWQVADGAKSVFAVEADDERKAAMVSNMLVVLTSDSRVTPVVNTGSLYA
ncbi:MAG: SPFH domain-containing protein [Actinomycetota bacterium]